ncbi:MAG: glycosyltransferase family 39 protein [Candidatus Eremiobacteraeota bacterium]|nr:glycosyltransferase family 39 protein [Candidatus Eremiobacteraeota bacterium]
MSDDNKKNENPNRIKVLGFSIDKRILAALFIFLFISIYLFQNYLFIQKDTAPSQTDSHIFRTHRMYEVFFQGKKHDIHMCAYPPLIHIVVIPFFKFMGISINVARFSVSVFTVIFLIAMFGIGYELGGYYSGAAVMALAGSCPWILDYSRIYMQDFPQTAMTALAFYFLLKSRSYKNRVVSVILGIVLALSLLTKWSSAFFITLPLLWFLVPEIFRSKRAFITFLGSIIAFFVIGWGTLRFFNQMSNLEDYARWPIYYLIFIIAPSVIYFVITLLFERKWKKNENYTNSPTYRIINFSFMLIICLVIFLLWFLWASPEIKIKFFADVVAPRDFSLHKQVVINFIFNMFNFASVLMAAGVVFMSIFRRNLYRKLLLPVTLAAVSIIMYHLMFEGYRYILSLVIFGAALGGYWIADTKWLKPVLAFILVGISVMTISAHTFIPGNAKIFEENPTRIKLLKSEAPDKSYYNIDPVIDSIDSPGMENEYKEVIFYRCRYFPFSIEYIRWRAMQKGKKICPKFSWEEFHLNRMKLEIESIKSNSYIDMDPVEDIMIIHESDQFPEEPVNDILKLFSGVPYEKKVFIVGEGYSITLIKLKRKNKEME